MRKYLRNLARHNMRRQGIERFNKTTTDANGKTVPSFFSRHWREFV